MAQLQQEEQDYYNWFDGITGVENSNLYEGTLTVENYALEKGSHRFFESPNYLVGSIVYDDETYFNISMKYDIYEDELLLGLRSDSGIKLLQLVKDRIKGFTIDGHRFRSMGCGMDEQVQGSGFYEVLQENASFSFLKKHYKEKFSKYGKNRIFHKFVDKTKYFLFYKNSCYTIKSKKDIFKIFPQFRTELNSRSPRKSKASNEAYLTRLLQTVDYLISNEKTTIPE
ncbi:hypothetical protein [Flagellimonas flava]|uniref:Uncharacterized protein n=1 Tax=Flagellimonas flava TaxID=570519 RepID=A0A1M5I104_9FLAO|nr:hypothetical protein [Allomuricauda flava]SHG21822.1 hypothetical protein SAMN04488116_0349 [Allomuricauda flava]